MSEPTPSEIRDYWRRQVDGNMPSIRAIQEASGCDQSAAFLYYSARCLSNDINSFTRAIERMVDQLGRDTEVEEVDEDAGEWEKPRRVRIRRVPPVGEG